MSTAVLVATAALAVGGLTAAAIAVAAARTRTLRHPATPPPPHPLPDEEPYEPQTTEPYAETDQTAPAPHNTPPYGSPEAVRGNAPQVSPEIVRSDVPYGSAGTVRDDVPYASPGTVRDGAPYALPETVRDDEGGASYGGSEAPTFVGRDVVPVRGGRQGAGEVERPVVVADTLAWLRAVEGVEQDYLLNLADNVVGRSSDCDVVLPEDDRTISRRHLRVVWADGRWWLIPFRTPHGTFVDGVLVRPGERVSLERDSLLRVGGRAVFRLFVPSPVPGAARMFMTAAGRSVQGGRRRNDDAFLAGAGVVATADGLSRRPAGGLAARLAVEGIIEGDHTRGFGPLLRRINSVILERGARDEELAGLATTLDVAALNLAERAVLGAHVGDGTALVQTGRRLTWLTRPHTFAREMVDAGELSPREGARHPDGGALVRAIGLADDVRADYWTHPAEVGQRYLLATDGLLRALGPERLEHLLLRLRERDAAGCADTLVGTALEAEAADNVTVVVADIVGER